MTEKNLVLLPAPRQLSRLDGNLKLEGGRLILLDDPLPQRLRLAALRLGEALQSRLGQTWELQAELAGALPAGGAHPIEGVTLQVRPAEVRQDQGYRLEVTPTGIHVQGHDPAGVFYGVCTLIQLIQSCGAELPCLKILDWPDFPARGVMLDISRDKVPTMQTLRAVVDKLAGWKVNQLQLYTVHTFAYRRHPEVWREASPMTGQEIMELDIYCGERFIELVPNQNSFGHLAPWLKLPAYAGLAELTGKFQSEWGEMEGPFSLCPVDPGSLKLVRSLYDELLPHFSSRMVNVGCDETVDLGLGRSKAACEQRGSGRVYLDFLLDIYQDVRRRGFRMQFWGDIIMNYPELIPEVPKDVIALEWGYEANHPFEAHLRRFAEAGMACYVCPGTSSWNSLAGRTQNALGNLLSAAENGLHQGASGYLITDWGDNGHWQVLPVSYLGFAAGAAYSWALETNRSLDIPEALNRYAFEDRCGLMGRLAYDLGDVYRLLGVEIHNATGLFYALQKPLTVLRQNPLLEQANFNRPLEQLDQAAFELSHAHPETPDAALILNEYALTIRMLRHACRRGGLAQNPEVREAASLQLELGADLQDLVKDYQEIWLRRYRPGGLPDSLARFEAAKLDYVA